MPHIMETASDAKLRAQDNNGRNDNEVSWRRKLRQIPESRERAGAVRRAFGGRRAPE